MNQIPHDLREDIGLTDEPFTPFTPFTPNRKKLPAALGFPIDAMPTACRVLIREAAASIGCPPDFIGLPMLVTLGGAIGNSRRLQVKAGYSEGASIYAAVIADPGDKKSPAQRVAVEPAMQQQAKYRKEYLGELDGHKRELREYEVEKADARKDNVAAPPPPEAPTMTRTVVGDTTIEALARILSENPRGVGVFRDELSGWVRAMDQYRAGGKGSDRQFWLSTWSNEAAQFDRKGQLEPVFLYRPFAGLLGSIQPDILPELQNDRDDGMLERFLFAYPDPVLSDWTDDEVQDTSRQTYANLYLNLRSLEMSVDENLDPAPKPVELSKEARVVFVEAYNDHIAERRAPGFPRALRGVWPKLAGYLLRISLILAMSRVVTSDKPERVEASDVLNAVMLLRYFKNQAYRTYTQLHGESAEDLLAYDLFKFLIDQGGYFEGTGTELFQAFKSNHKPKNASWLTKKVQDLHGFELSEETVAIKAEHTETGWSTRRCIRVALQNSVNDVNGVNGWRGET